MRPIITLDMLRQHDACTSHQDLFVATFGQSAELTKSNWAKAIKIGINVSLAACLLSGPALDEYLKVRGAAWVEYEKVTSTAWIKYVKVRDKAWAKYVMVSNEAWAKYKKVNDTTWVKYSKVCNAAHAEYSKVRNAALYEALITDSHPKKD